MAIDLADDKQFRITVADHDPQSLVDLKEKYSLETLEVDLSQPEKVKSVIADYDLVIDALPGFLGFQTFRAAIEAGKNIVDIAFFAEDPLPLNDLAREKGAIAIMDCGVAPGMSNLLVGFVDLLLDETESVEIYVGGLPQIREWPYEYKSVFSPVDVIEEYTRPARYIENGKQVIRPALSDAELINFPGIGTLEAFNTDGLRTLMQTIRAPKMKEKTLRYPGHIEKMAVLRETGFFSQEPIDFLGQRIRPLDFTARLLFPLWEMKAGDEDLTVMKIIVKGKKDSQNFCYTYDLLDRFDRKSGTTSMARTTGYTATMAARMLAAGLYQRKGISPPEYIGQNPRCVDFILKGLKERGIIYRETINRLE
ncbi:MAG: saccharopine dehydrogenase family protein [Calditrichia bacterium]